ncbi:MAG: SpoIID/LytB domain-containing protein [Clostridiales bacterium]|nr:SpoIID/LytB domain-containing protein [Clostridiales bacterium]
MITFLLLLLVLFVLYKENVIFVKYADQAVLIAKTEESQTYNYKFLMDKKVVNLKSKDKSINIRDRVVNFKYRNDTIVELLSAVKPVNEKVMSRHKDKIELEFSGDIGYSNNLNVYKISGGNFSNASTSSIIVGSGNISVYKDKRNNARTIIIEGTMQVDHIRVGLKSDNFQSFMHGKLSFISDDGVKVEDKKAKKVFIADADSRIDISPEGNGIAVSDGTNNIVFKNRVYVSSVNGNRIKVLSYKRSYGYPDYKGVFEVTRTGGKLQLINEVDIEDYLHRVIPSEMPSSFGLEALKAQAVAARTYAISDLLSGRYADMGFHVDDSTLSQVYNNNRGSSITDKAVDDTKGIVMTYDGNLVDAKYYSTSHGYSASADEIWSSNGKFPGTKVPYLAVQSFLLSNQKYDLSKEADALKFFKDWSLKSYDLNSPYFRWKVNFTKDELKNTIEKNLPLIYEDQKDYILTLSGNEFKSIPIPEKPLGDLMDITVSKRGGGGNIMELIIKGSRGTYKVLKELNVRYVIRPRKSDTGSGRDIAIKRIKSGDLINNSLLPSAFMVFDIIKDSEGSISNINIYGGGFGHGVGMSQYGAGYLSSKGYTFDKILKTYYHGVTIQHMQ